MFDLSPPSESWVGTLQVGSRQYPKTVTTTYGYKYTPPA